MKREDFSKMSIDEKLALVERMYIKYPRAEAIIERIEYIRGHSRIALEPEDCILLTGNQGAGKSRLIEHYGRRFSRRQVEKETKEGIKIVTTVPILIASIPSKANDKSLVTELLYRLGDPEAKMGTTTNQKLRLEELVNVCEVEMFILDEFQNFMDRESETILKNVANCLKDILIKTKKPMVLAGMPYSADVLDDNPQLNRRFTKRFALDPLRWNSSPKKDCELKAFLQVADDALPLPCSSHLSDHDTAFRFYSATGGVVASVMKIVRRAAAFALRRSAERIEIDDLAAAYNDQLADSNPDNKNPFEGHVSAPGRSSAKPSPPPSDGTNRRVKSPFQNPC